MMIKTVYLDAGGVILDEKNHEKIRAGIITGVIRKYKNDYTENSYRRDLKEAINKYAVHIYDFIFWKNIRDNKLFNEAVTQYKEDFKNMNPPLELMRGIKKIITELSKKYNVGIIGQYGLQLIELLDSSRISKYIKYKNHQDEYRITKPDPRYYELILINNNENPEECIMIGDRIDKDIIPAKQVGMRTVRILTGIHKNQKARYPEETADVEINRISEIPDAVKRICEL